MSPAVVALRWAMAVADLYRALGLPRPHVRLEVRRGDEVRSVALTLCELPDLTFALLRAPRALAAAARRVA